MILKVLKSAVVTAMGYCLSLMMAFFLYNLFFDLPADHNRVVSGIFIGLFVMILPYVLLGIYINVIHVDRPLRASLCIGLFAILCERISIYFIGWSLVRGGVVGWSNETMLSPINFVHAEALPYFTPAYIILGGIASLVICVITTFWHLKVLKRKRLKHKLVEHLKI